MFGNGVRLLFGVTLVVLACKSPEGSRVAADETALASTTGTWSELTTIRDDTKYFDDQSDPLNGLPNAGGWWVTPIHATLLPKTGEVLLTGWGRKDEHSCHVHGASDSNAHEAIGSRRNGTTFVIDPAVVGEKPTITLTKEGDASSHWLQEDFLSHGETKDVMYCSGHVPLSDGRVLYTGGAQYYDLGKTKFEVEFGLDYLRVFDPTARKIERVKNAAGETQRLSGGPKFPLEDYGTNVEQLFAGLRDGDGHVNTAWYPTNLRLPNGKVLIASGFVNCCNKSNSSHDYSPNNTFHVFDPKNAAEPVKLLLAHGSAAEQELITPGQKDYTQMHLLHRPVTLGGKTFQIAMFGYRGRVVLFNYLTKEFGLPAHGQRPKSFGPDGPSANGAMAWDATSVLLPDGRLLIFGGTEDSQISQRADLYDFAADSWSHIDTGVSRENAVTQLLPDGRVLLTNGWTDTQAATGDEEGRKTPVIIDPVSGVIERLAMWPDARERGYHSFALLLKDARILVGGGTFSPREISAEIGCEQSNMRRFSPPYLSKGPRPVFGGDTSALKVVPGGSEMTMTLAPGTSLDPKHGVALLAPGAMTHAFDQNQRYLSLAFTQDGTTLRVTPPRDHQEAPPGDYLLYLVSADGVPSEGRYVVVP